MTFRKKIGFLILAAVFLWIGTVVWICHTSPRWITDQLSRRTGSEVSVGTVRSNYLNTLSIHNLVLKGKTSTDIPVLIFTFRPWDILHPNRILKITLKNPAISISKPIPGQNLSASSLPVFPVPGRFVIENGRFTGLWHNQSLSLSTINGTIDFNQSMANGRITAELNSIGTIKSNWSIDLLEGHKIKMDLEGNDLDLHAIQTELGEQASAYGIWGGRTDVKAHVTSSKKDVIWEVEAKGNKSHWSRSIESPKIPTSFHVHIQPDQVNIDSLILRNVFSTKAKITNLKSHPVIHGTLESSDTSLSQIFKLIGDSPAHPLLDGPINFHATLNGDITSPEVDGFFGLSATYARLIIPPIEGGFHIRDRQFISSASFSGGLLEMTGRFNKTASNVFELTLKDLSLGDFGASNNWDNVNGKLNSQLSMQLQNHQPSLEGNFLLTDLQWGRLRSEEDCAGTVDLSRNRLSLLTKNESITAKAVKNQSLIELEEFKLDFGNGFSFLAHGTADLSNDRLNMVINGKSLPPDLWPPLVARYPQIEGSLDFTGTLIGRLVEPESRFDFIFHDLKFIPEGRKWNGTTELLGLKSNFTLRNINVDGGYNGEVSRQYDEALSKEIWKVNANLFNAAPQLIWDIFKSTQSTGGSLSGQMNFRWDGKNAIGTSSVTWTSGHIGEFWFDEAAGTFLMSPKNWEIPSFSLLKGPRALRAEGVATPNGNDWNYEALVQMQRWGSDPFTLDGEFRSTGHFSVSDSNFEGKIWAPVLWLGNASMEDVKATVRGDKNAWTLKGSAGIDTRVDIKIQRDTNKIAGLISGQSFRLENMASQIAPNLDVQDIPTGQLGLRVSINGNLNAPELKLNATVERGTWRNENFSSEIAAEINPSTITILTSKTDFDAGGTMFMNGHVKRDNDTEYNLEGTASGIPLNSIFHLLKWKFKWDGSTDLSFIVSGKKSNPMIMARFSGDHNGLAPFRESGTINGEISGSLKELDLSGIRVESGDGYVKLLSGSKVFLDRTGAGKMRVAVESRNLRAGYVTFFGNMEVTGSWDSPKNYQEPHMLPVELDVFARSLWINQFYLDGNVTHLTFQEGELQFSPIPGSGQQLSGTLLYKELPLLEIKDFRFIDEGIEKIKLDGFIGSTKWDYILDTKEVDAALIRGLFDTTIPVSGPVSAHITGRGTPENPNIEAKVNWTDGNISLIPLDVADCDIIYKNHLLNIFNITAVKKKGYQLTGLVQVQTDSEENESRISKLDLNLQRGDLTFLSEVFPDISKSRGTFEGNLQMSQTGKKPIISGYLTGQKISIRSVYTPLLQKGSVDIRFEHDKLVIHSASATIGEGIVALSGTVEFGGKETKKYDLRLKSITEDGIMLRIPQLAIAPGPVLGRFSLLKRKLAGISRGEPTIDLTLTGPASSPTLAGNIDLKNTVFTFPPSTTATPVPKSPYVTTWWRHFRDTLQWDVHLNAGSRTWYQNELVDAAVTGTMAFSGPTSNLNVNGRIDTEQGSIVYSGNEFKIKNAELEIETHRTTLDTNSPKKTYVYLKAMAEKEVYYTDALSNNNQDTIVMVVDRSLLGEIQPRFYSKNNPNLSSQRALQLALGLPFTDSIESGILLPDQRATERERNKEETDKLLRIGLVQLLDSSLASPLARAIAQHTGLVDFIRVTYQDRDPYSDSGADTTDFSAPTNDVTQNEFLRYTKGTKVKFGRGLSRRLFADYSFRVDEYQEKLDLRHEVELAYRLHQNFFLRGITELDSERTLGRPPDRRAILENQWRFGLPRKKKAKIPDESRSPLKQEVEPKSESG